MTRALDLTTAAEGVTVTRVRMGDVDLSITPDVAYTDVTSADLDVPAPEEPSNRAYVRCAKCGHGRSFHEGVMGWACWDPIVDDDDGEQT